MYIHINTHTEYAALVHVSQPSLLLLSFPSLFPTVLPFNIMIQMSSLPSASRFFVNINETRSLAEEVYPPLFVCV